jgi:hypothetical protein
MSSVLPGKGIGGTVYTRPLTGSVSYGIASENEHEVTYTVEKGISIEAIAEPIAEFAQKKIISWFF